MKKIAGKLHLVVGLATGIVFMLVCLTGAFIAFTEESLNVVNRNHLKVAASDAPRVPVEKFLETYNKEYPLEKVFVFNAYREGDRSYDFFSAVLKPGTKEDFDGYKMVYADPYTGKILHVDRWTLQLIILAVTMHVNLLMGDFGHGLIKYCTLLFFAQLLLGLILWWPRSRAALKGAVTLAWNAGKRRRLYDSHRTVAFYASAGLIVMVATSLVMSWTWVAKPVMAAFGGEPSLVHDHEEEHVHPKRKEGPEFSLEGLKEKVLAANPAANQITFLMPQHDTIGTVTLRAHSQSTFVNFAVGEPTEFDRVTGEQDMGEEARGDARNSRIYATNLLIHMGFWGGTPTKILYFLLGITGATLPVTGFFIWKGKRKQRKSSAASGKTENAAQPAPMPPAGVAG